MRSNPIPLMMLLLFGCFGAIAQPGTHRLFLQGGTIDVPGNLDALQVSDLNIRIAKNANGYVVILQFEQIPTSTQISQLSSNGIRLLNYIPSNAYTAVLSSNIDPVSLRQWGIRAVVELSADQKMQPALVNGFIPAYATRQPGTVDVWVSFHPTLSMDSIGKILRQLNFDLLDVSYKSQRVLILRSSTLRLRELAALPFVEFVQAAPPAVQSLNNFSRINGRATVLAKPASLGGRALTGKDITIGIGDDADPIHVDFSARGISRAAVPANFHGTHVSGTAGGAGIWKERYAGYAPQSKLLFQAFSGVWEHAPAYYLDHRMVITNNSYGNETVDCAYSGFYDFTARFLDQLAFDLPKVSNVFAVGNSGVGFPMDCSPYPAGFRSVLGGYQSAKNVITVGNMYANFVIFPQSSRGPARDGRIKPEITAQGAFVVSTATFADYFSNTGTSMAAPGVAGGLALLYQRYRELFGAGTDPDNALMKAILCNTAEDKGNPGPDYSFGFGAMNLARAVQVLEDGNYTQQTVTQGADNTFSIVAPPGTARLKVMLYWNDPVPSPLSSKALVNDLDLSVTTTSPAATYLPLVLDPNPGAVEIAAQPRIDTLNNIEQVTIDNPVAGTTYTVHVKGTTVPNAPLPYYVTYDIVPVSTTLAFPVGGEKLLPGDNLFIAWDAYGDPAETFTLEYSSDGGATWDPPMNNSIGSTVRQYAWTVPATATNQGRIRLTRNNTGMVSTSDNFTILGAPHVSLSSTQCEGYIAIDWTPVTSATGYEVMKLEGEEMKTVATVPSGTLSWSIGGLSKDSVYWVTVRALNGAFSGARDTAVFRQPNTGTCAGSISDNDLKVDSLVSPSRSGRKFTSTELSAVVPITVQIKNLDDVTSNTSFDVSYYINNVLQQTQTITPSIPAGGIYQHTFSNTADFSAVDDYQLKVQIVKAGDPVQANDTLVKQIRQLDNQPVTLPFIDNFDAAPVQTVQQTQMGLAALDRYDFTSSTSLGRVRTFINTGIAYSGNRALTLDAQRYNPGGTIDSITGTYYIDLTGYIPATDEIRLDFQYKNHGQKANAANKVWVRGSDNDEWREVYDLFANQPPADGSFKRSASIELSDTLARVPSQAITSSLQVRWGQYGIHQAADDESGAGYTFDDVRLYKVRDDLQLISIDAPSTSSCGLGVNTPITITVKNSRNSVIPASPGVSVRYRIDGGSWVDDIIPGMAAQSSTSFTFATGANLSAPGVHLIETEVVFPTDTFDENDTLSKRVTNLPLISSFPYLEDFELSDGGLYTGGKLSSWEYGTPSSVKINRAASGSKAWKTRINGTYNDTELSYLYTPCFNVSALTNPTLSFSLAFDIEDCGASLCDGAYVEYSTDGNTWSRLGTTGSGFNWYNKDYAGNTLWSNESDAHWHVATIPLSATGLPIPSITQIRFRFVMSSDQGLNKDGIAIDDIHVYDNIYGIYDGITMAAPVTASIPGNTGWIDFIQDNKLVASVNSPVTALGSTDVQTYIHTGGVRSNNDQYYHDRNITIKPAVRNTGIDSAIVRFYFLDTETENLINATGCSTCYKPRSAYELGVSKYTDPNYNFENGTIIDDLQGGWSFIQSPRVRKVPFDKGYYAEFRVRDFSEFWLNNGGFDLTQPLPVQLVRFNAQKSGLENVLVQWTTASEQDVVRYEIEVARGNMALQQNQFERIGEVPGQGNSNIEQHYSFTDLEPGKSGVRYYRLRIVERDGRFTYSVIRPVVFESGQNWIVFPNPSNGAFQFQFQAMDGEMLQLRLMDVTGRVIYGTQARATGFTQKIAIDLRSEKYADGLYLLEVTQGNRRQHFRLMKQR